VIPVAVAVLGVVLVAISKVVKPTTVFNDDKVLVKTPAVVLVVMTKVLTDDDVELTTVDVVTTLVDKIVDVLDDVLGVDKVLVGTLEIVHKFNGGVVQVDNVHRGHATPPGWQVPAFLAVHVVQLVFAHAAVLLKKTFDELVASKVRSCINIVCVMLNFKQGILPMFKLVKEFRVPRGIVMLPLNELLLRFMVCNDVRPENISGMVPLSELALSVPICHLTSPAHEDGIDPMKLFLSI